MSKRAVLYARVSYDDRDTDGRNLKGQLEMCREYAQEHDYTIVAELAEDDRGASGASFELPELGRARGLAEAGQADVIVTREIDRLSRRLAKQLIVEEELKRYGVLIEYVLGEYPDTPEGNLMKNVKASIAEYEREKINERMVRGRRLAVRDGNILVGACPAYGYRVAEVDGKTTLQIYEPEARIVRLIFQWCTKGDEDGQTMTLRGIAKRLTDTGIPTPSVSRGRKTGRREWSPFTIRGVLKNETYTGIWYYGKHRKRRQKSRTRWVTNPSETWIAVAVPCIIEQGVWDVAQIRLRRNQEMASRNNTKNPYLLSKRVTCGLCGYKMTGSTRRQPNGSYYRCCSRWKEFTDHKCRLPTFRVDQVDAAVWAWVKSFLVDPAALTHGLQAEQADREEVNRPLRDRLAVLDDLLAHNQQQLDRLIDLYLTGDFAKEMLTERKTRLESTINALQREREVLTTQIKDQTLTSRQIQTVVDFAATVRERLEEADADFDARRRLIEMLDVRATLTIENEEKVVDVQCMLGEQVLPFVNATTGDPT